MPLCLPSPFRRQFLPREDLHPGGTLEDVQVYPFRRPLMGNGRTPCRRYGCLCDRMVTIVGFDEMPGAPEAPCLRAFPPRVKKGDMSMVSGFQGIREPLLKSHGHVNNSSKTMGCMRVAMN